MNEITDDFSDRDRRILAFETLRWIWEEYDLND